MSLSVTGCNWEKSGFHLRPFWNMHNTNFWAPILLGPYHKMIVLLNIVIWSSSVVLLSQTEQLGLSGFVLLRVFQIPWLSMTFSMTFCSFPWPKVYWDASFEICQNHPCFWGIFWHNSSAFYFVFASTSAIIYVPHVTILFHDRQLNSMTFQAWKLKYFNSMIFQVFHYLHEPCLFFVSSAKPIVRAKGWCWSLVGFHYWRKN